MSKPFKLNSAFRPSGDQPEAIRRLKEGLEDGLAHQTLLGVTGSGKTFTVANKQQSAERMSEKWLKFNLRQNKTSDFFGYPQMEFLFNICQDRS